MDCSALLLGMITHEKYKTEIELTTNLIGAALIFNHHHTT